MFINPVIHGLFAVYVYPSFSQLRHMKNFRLRTDILDFSCKLSFQRSFFFCKSSYVQMLHVLDIIVILAG